MDPDNDFLTLVLAVNDLIITGGRSNKLNVFKIDKNNEPIQTIPLKNKVFTALFVEPDTLYMGCMKGHLYINKLKSSKFIRHLYFELNDTIHSIK
jgi:hypothetical protein